MLMPKTKVKGELVEWKLIRLIVNAVGNKHGANKSLE